MKWTNGMIKQIAMQQSALDANCSVKDFICGKNMVIVSKENELARKYLKLPHVCNLISYRKENNHFSTTISGIFIS